jgi:hypothetical protein
MNPIATAARLACRDIYPPISPTVFDAVYTIGETVCGTRHEHGSFYIVCQGTKDWPGWMADADVVPFSHSQFGPVHAGFWRNIPALVTQLAVVIPADVPIYVTGHSKGAGEGALLGAELKRLGFDVTQLILFACPHPGYQPFADWLAVHLPNGVSYRNAPSGLAWLGDPVPMVWPYPYVAPYPLHYIDVPPDGVKRAVDVEWHMGELYLRATCIDVVDGALA